MSGPRAVIVMVIAGCALLVVLTVPTAAAATVESSVAGSPAPLAADVGQGVAADSFEAQECPVDVPAEHRARVTCGALIVAERRTEDGDPTRTLRLPVAVIASRSPEPAADPLVFPTAGGPGAGSLSALGYFLDYGNWATDDRDVILVEQRGDALAEPSLNCPELDIENFVVDGALLPGAQSRALRSEKIEACRARLVQEGVDLATYSSAASAADLTDLRAALGYDPWNLYGISYGARVALTTMRDRPEGLRAVILDGVYPPQINLNEATPAGFTSALDTLFAACAADAACSSQYPDLEDDLLEVLARAAETPFSVTVKHPVDRSPLALEVSDTDLTAGLFDAFYDANVVRVLPFLIDRLAGGDAESVVPLAQNNVDFADYFTEGLHLSIDCAEEAPFTDDDRIAAALAAEPILAHYALSDGFREDCELWAVPALAATENAAVVSDIPTLLTTGGYDPVTPAAFAESTAQTLSMHYRYDFPGMGHGAVWANWVDDCAAGIAQQFLRDPATEPNASCIQAIPATDFLTGEDIHPTSAIYRFDSDVVKDRDPIQIAILAFTLLVLITTLGYGAAYGLARRGRRHGNAPGGAVLAAVTAAALNLAYVGAMLLVLGRTDPLILGFGLPTGIRPLLIVPFIALGSAILLIVLMVPAWMQRGGRLSHRVALSVSAFASLSFAAWLLSRGLLML